MIFRYWYFLGFVYGDYLISLFNLFYLREYCCLLVDVVGYRDYKGRVVVIVFWFFYYGMGFKWEE